MASNLLEPLYSVLQGGYGVIITVTEPCSYPTETQRSRMRGGRVVGRKAKVDGFFLFVFGFALSYFLSVVNVHRVTFCLELGGGGVFADVSGYLPFFSPSVGVTGGL